MFNGRFLHRVSQQSIIIVLILLAALGLRLWGINFGLPYEYHVDEVQYVRQAASMGEDGLEPTWWNNPPFFKYVLLAEYSGLYGVGRLFGWYSSTHDFGAQSTFDPSLLYLLGRVTSALLGTLTVYLVYLIGKEGYNGRTGIIAASFLATSFIHVRDSHYATNDIAVTFLITIALLAAIKITTSHQKRWYVLAGSAVGLGIATKYTAVFAVSPLIVAHLLSPDIQFKKPIHLQINRLILFAACVVAAAIIGSPYFIITPQSVISDAYEALYLAGQRGFEGWEIDPAGGYIFYFKTLVWGLGWPLLIIALASLLKALNRRSAADWILFIYIGVMYALMGRQQMYFSRFVLPIIPALLILAASLTDSIITKTIHSRSKKASAALTVLILGLITIQPITSIIRHNYLLTMPDTRSIAKQWIETNIANEAKIATDWPMHGPPLSTSSLEKPQSNRTYNVTIIGAKGLSEHPLDWYKEKNYDYLITTSFINEIPLQDAQRQASRVAFYASLDHNLELVYEIRPHEGEQAPTFIFDEIYGPAVSLWERDYPGPTIKVYAIR